MEGEEEGGRIRGVRGQEGEEAGKEIGGREGGERKRVEEEREGGGKEKSRREGASSKEVGERKVEVGGIEEWGMQEGIRTENFKVTPLRKSRVQLQGHDEQ